MFRLIKGAEVYAPAGLGERDLLIQGESIVAVGRGARGKDFKISGGCLFLHGMTSLSLFHLMNRTQIISINSGVSVMWYVWEN